MKRILFRIAATVVIILALATGAAIWIFTGHGFDVADFDQVDRLMPQEDVQRILGPPDSIWTNKAGAADFWIYSRHFKLCRGIVYFGGGDVVADTFHDH